MSNSSSLLETVQGAFSAQHAGPRGAALASLRGAFLQNRRPVLEADASNTPAARDYAQAWRRMKSAAQSAPADELQLVAALERQDDAQAVCIQAEIARLPAQVVELALHGRDLDALLILGRALNLAWSTMRLLLGARRHLIRPGADDLAPDGAEIARVALDFDEFPRPMAERALRFIRTFALAMNTAV